MNVCKWESAWLLTVRNLSLWEKHEVYMHSVKYVRAISVFPLAGMILCFCNTPAQCSLALSLMKQVVEYSDFTPALF